MNNAKPCLPSSVLPVEKMIDGMIEHTDNAEALALVQVAADLCALSRIMDRCDYCEIDRAGGHEHARIIAGEAYAAILKAAPVVFGHSRSWSFPHWFAKHWRI